MLTNTVVMTTYNGERYLTEQLESLMAQEMLPDEIIVADDCSTDGSFAMVRTFAETHPEVEWNVYRNEYNLGWKLNFKEAIAKARGEFIYLCDQDDIWTPNHIADLYRAMVAHPEADVMTSHAEPFYEEGAYVPVGAETDNPGSGTVTLVPTDYRYILILNPGCTYCVRRSFTESLRPFWPDGAEHDAFLYSAACIERALGHLDATTLRFRRHANNASDMRTKNRDDSLELLYGYLEKNQAIREWLTSLDEKEIAVLKDRGAFDLLDATDKFVDLRISALKKPSLVSLARLIPCARRYPTRRSMLGDFACALFPNKDWHR